MYNPGIQHRSRFRAGATRWLGVKFAVARRALAFLASETSLHGVRRRFLRQKRPCTPCNDDFCSKIAVARGAKAFLTSKTSLHSVQWRFLVQKRRCTACNDDFWLKIGVARGAKTFFTSKASLYSVQSRGWWEKRRRTAGKTVYSSKRTGSLMPSRQCGVIAKREK